MAHRFSRPRRGFIRLAALSVLVTITTAGAIVVNPLPQVVTPSEEPILKGAVYVGMGLVLLWFAHLGITLKSGVERLALRVDDPQTGLVAELSRHVQETRMGMGQLSNELEEVKQEVGAVKATCVATHQRQSNGG